MPVVRSHLKFKGLVRAGYWLPRANLLMKQRVVVSVS